MKQHEQRLKKGIVVRTSYGIATVHDMWQSGGEGMVSLEFWRDITQSDRTFAISSWPVEKCEFVAASEQEYINFVIGEDYL